MRALGACGGGLIPPTETIHSDADRALSAGPLAVAIPALHRRVPGLPTTVVK